MDKVADKVPELQSPFWKMIHDTEEMIQKHSKIKKPKKVLSAEELAAKEAKRKVIKVLNAREPEEWADLILGIKQEDVQTRVACIIWWDYFADREVPDRWPHLDCYLSKAFPPGKTASIDPCNADVAAALERMGYSSQMAHDRVYRIDDPVASEVNEGKDDDQDDEDEGYE